MDTVIFQKLVNAAEADKYLPSLRQRVEANDGQEGGRLLTEIWPSIHTILALSDFATDLQRK